MMPHTQPIPWRWKASHNATLLPMHPGFIGAHLTLCRSAHILGLYIHVQCPYVDMKKFFFFRTSSNEANNTPSPPSKEKQFKEVSAPSLRRSLSLSSGSFYDSGLGKKNFRDSNRSPCHSKKVHSKKSGRDSCRYASPSL
ncbi:hypothetical protein RND71_025868 [Anisodus tanguticus]|uniref:Uncharacterized protein n=1 Tax=Anisodus tanguticus TaxID=243964 RepID=A0AAE1RM60_9SOLA|nr:hypothetical protein RND71_025868 [Anisodus tanguticus]